MLRDMADSHVARVGLSEWLPEGKIEFLPLVGIPNWKMEENGISSSSVAREPARDNLGMT